MDFQSSAVLTELPRTDRIDVDLTSENYIEIDESNKKRINNFSELAVIAHQSSSSRIMKKHFY